MGAGVQLLDLTDRGHTRAVAVAAGAGAGAGGPATVLRKKGSRRKPILRVPFGAPAGTVRRGFAARLRSKPLRRGRYVLRLAAVDTAGNRSKTASVPFRVVR